MDRFVKGLKNLGVILALVACLVVWSMLPWYGVLALLAALAAWLVSTRSGHLALAAARIGIAGLPQRWGASSVIVIGIAGVVGVLVAMLAMSAGFKATLDSTGGEDTAIILRGGSQAETNSVITRDQTPLISALAGIEKGLQAARRTANGYEPYPNRAAIEDGVLGDLAKPIVYLREPGEAFIIHVQGSARIRLDDGSVMRVAYAGRNGRPYTSIGRLLVQRGEMDLETMTLEKLMGWLKDHPEPARALMRQNQSYIFFREASELAPEDGPIGGAGTPLVPGRSLAVDRSLWAYGLPVWLDGHLPLTLDKTEPLRRLMIAQDTGSAIVGPARGDFFFGGGEEAGRRAGLLRHAVRFVVLQPKPRS